MFLRGITKTNYSSELYPFILILLFVGPPVAYWIRELTLNPLGF